MGRSVAEIYAGAMLDGLPRFDSGEPIEKAHIVEIKSETFCVRCNGELSWGNNFLEDERNQNKYHIGCGNDVASKNPIMEVFLRRKSWPPQKFNQQR